MEKTGSKEMEINKRIERAITVYSYMSKSFINRREISAEIKMNVYGAIYRLILTYGCETEILKSRVQAIEMKYLTCKRSYKNGQT